MENKITDKYNRAFKTLRISLLNRCNLSCVYCTMGEDLAVHNKHNDHHLSPTELNEIVTRLHELLHLETVRLTGGEPLLYHNIEQVIDGIKQIGIPQIKLTTNGFLLEKMAEKLKRAGLQSINVSLDAIDEPTFFKMSKRANVQQIINGIDKALAIGLQVKLNAVIMKGINESQVLPLLQFAFSRNITIRFLEVMPMGYLHQQPQHFLFTQHELLQQIATVYNFTPCIRKNGSTANYWQTDDGHQFGVIANHSSPFCADCNRLRMDSKGNMYGCLSSNHPISIKEITNKEQLIGKLQEAMNQKQLHQFTGSNLSMLDIGG